MNFPQQLWRGGDSGTDSRCFFVSAAISATKERVPRNAASGEAASQLRLGNSTHNPEYSSSSSDQVTR